MQRPSCVRPLPAASFTEAVDPPEAFWHRPFVADAIEAVTREALNLPLHQRLALAGYLLESADGAPDLEAEAAWDTEIRDRIRAIDEGRVSGIPYEDVMRDAEQRLTS